MADELAAILPLPAALADNAFAPLAGVTPLVRVVHGMPGAVVVAAAASLVDRVHETLAAQGLSAVDVVSVQEQGSRAQYLSVGLEHFHDSTSHVLIYDVLRPLVPESVRDRVIAALRAGSPVVMPVLAVTDSVKAVDANGSVTGTLDRSMLRAVQYPRGFTINGLARLLAGRTSDLFDELDEALRTGTPVALVDGDADAFVAELPRDTDYVEAIIASRQD